MSHPEETTFKGFDSTKAATYNTVRGAYPPQVYDIIYDFHQSASPPGSFGTCVDLGCGPGNSTRPLIEKFQRVIGVDPSEGMVEAARQGLHEIPPEMREGVQFVVGKAEDLGDVGSADIITAATSAHWFDMPRFWTSASRVLRPGGTVALWATCSMYCHPSTPNAAEVQKILNHLEDEELGPYYVQGNRLCRNFYDQLLLPWQCEPPISTFSKQKYSRLEWDRGGLSKGSDQFFVGASKMSLKALAKRLGSASMVIRWREAYPELANTEDDVVLKAVEKVRGVVRRDEIDGGAGFVLLLFKKE